MLLKLKESIRNRGIQIRPPAIIDTEQLRISDASAAVLVRRGTAEHYDGVDPTDWRQVKAPAGDVVVGDGTDVEGFGQSLHEPEPDQVIINLGDDEPAAEAAPAADASKKSGKRGNK